MEIRNEGKKIFFLYPHSVIQGEMFDILIMAGFEAYALHDHRRAKKILHKFPDSIMFINIDEGLQEKEWEAYVREIQGDPALGAARLGILSYNADQKLMQKYLMDLGVPCGYIQLKLGIQASTRIILQALEANEARGRRRYIRAFCGNNQNVTLNYKSPKGMYYGRLLDISSAGVAAKMEDFEELPPNTRLRGVQFKLHGSLVMADVILMGKRQGDKDIYILLFENNLTTEQKMAIHHFIKETIQRDMDQLQV